MTETQYVVMTEDGTLGICTVERMAKAVEHAAYSGDEDQSRYFAYDENAGFVEVTFRCVEATFSGDDDDYLHYRYAVSPKHDDGMTLDVFMVTIDGRA